MKWRSSMWKCDTLELTWWDLVRLAFGRTLKDGALMVKRGKLPPGGS